MKYLRALWRFMTAPEFELWWGGLFLSQFLQLIKDYPQSGRTLWDLAYVIIVGIAFAYCTIVGINHVRKARP